MSDSFIKTKNIDLDKKMNINNLDFVGFVISGWHLNVLYSYLNANKDIFSDGLIVINPQSDINDMTKFRIKKEHIKNIKDIKIRYIMMQNNFKEKNKIKYLFTLKNLICKNKKNKKPLTIFSTNNINISLFKHFEKKTKPRNFRFVIIDEGTGTYVSKNTFLKSAGVKFFNRISKIVRSYLINIFMKVTNNSVQKYYLFSKENNSLKINKKVSDNLKKLFHEYRIPTLNKINKNQIFIIKDFIKKNDKIDELYISIIKKILEVSNKEIYIKKHPNDTNKILENFFATNKRVKIINSKYDAEDLYLKYEPDLIIGGSSTALLTISSIFNIEVVNISNLYLNDYFEVNNNYIDRIKLFEKYMLNNDKILYLNNIDKLKNFI
ncbi:hypothetical protein C8C77_10772 [Halanaerobium saccharolyticum]|uniref:Capsular polysaccharide biosynthesis protein n=1 Tax=Halanaerobium saccharolyticum TaxID=43595 RepID=A0A4R7Z7E7_9FIRM|nr:polysialyltransferase family glycosyltransferase [Halanaerobium saccharolyticum]RAK12627.1 hypothetical protein C7958_101189 [Halanaerobium saccharolyticum]TDW05461.1 hypothetical protein C8C77_10772 [Halanaerobium saccharolyticum]TDX62976.1 hypothetical protein C7956_103143 [Halanaerobium saccharolyticum]